MESAKASSVSGDVEELFDGARRSRGYGEREAASDTDGGDESQGGRPPAEARSRPPVQPRPDATAGDGAIEGKVVAPTTELALWRPETAGTAGLGGRWQLLGLGRRKRERQEAEARLAECERVMRQATWIRAVNVAVVNVKGAVGVTPAGLMVGGLLAQVRGGGVAIFEASAERRGLLDVAEGSPSRGLRELLVGAGEIRSAGTLAGYTAPQTSHAAVIGSIGSREQLMADDLPVLRELLDTYYQVTVSVLSHNLEAALGLASLRSADAVVIPAVLTRRALTGVARTVRVIARYSPHLLGRMVVALGHSGAPEDPQTAADAPAWLAAQLDQVGAEYGHDGAVAEVVPCPHEPVFIADGEFSLAAVTRASRVAWSDVTARTVQHISDEQPVNFEGERS